MIRSHNPNSGPDSGRNNVPHLGAGGGPSRAELAAWLRLNLTHGIGAATALLLLRAFGAPPKIFDASHRALREVVGAALATRLLAPDDETDTAVMQALEWAEQRDNHLLTLADTAYPASLLTIDDPPPLLYVKGQLTALRGPGIGIVGARHATPVGLDNAAAFSAALVSHGLTINSGLARGVDAAAHQGAITSEGLTVAVMGTGIDRIYPAANRVLAGAIVENGAMLTEMPMGTAAMRGNFPRRNRLIAGLSVGILVVEAARHSGSLITARQASEFGREVFAIPGSIHSPVSRGCHQLIRQGAKLVESAHDIITELNPSLGLASVQAFHQSERNPTQSNPENQFGEGLPDGENALLRRIGWEIVSVDALLAPDAAPSDATQLAHALLELELAGQIERLPDGRIQRRPSACGKASGR